MKGDDFFKPLWIRLAIVLACAGWTLIEWINGETGWAMMAGAVTIYGVWSFLYSFKPSSKSDHSGPSDGDKP